MVEHDLSVLDYLSDFICCLYGKPGVYGVVTLPFSVREGINIFLAGFVPTENLRFRDESLTFKVSLFLLLLTRSLLVELVLCKTILPCNYCATITLAKYLILFNETTNII